VNALVLNAVGSGFNFENVDIAAPIGREVLIDVQASGLCHTDLLFATNDFVPTPSVLGHEAAGVVAAVGPDVAQIRVGDDVVGSLAQSCGVLCSMSVRPVVPVQTSGVDSAPTE
jgi:S-(hydroxymethyl)glutathione dehydrogenase / alcohol dehydrogenase